MKKSKKINICIIRNDKMGDMILTLPIIREIKDSYPNSNINVICSNSNFFLCEEAPFVDRYYIFDKKDNFVSKLIYFVNQRKNSYDLLFNFSQDIRTFLMMLTINSVNKSIIIYLSRYGNPKYSKIFQRFITKIFSYDYVKIDRNESYKKKLKFHQTQIMYELVKKNLDIKKPKSFKFLPQKKHVGRIFQERILIHLSERWIDDEYSEELFLELIEQLKQNYGKLYLSTDQSSNKRFKKTTQLFEKFNDSNLYKLNECDKEIIILDKLNFQNWRKAIINSKLVITYECGCVHVASMSGVPLLVVYNYKNEPYMINEEYAPLTNKYQKVIANQEFINQEIMLKLKEWKSLILD